MAWTIEAKWLLCLFLLFFPMAAFASSSEERWGEDIYPDMQEVLESCESALKFADKDIKSFLRTPCAANINGVLWTLGYLKWQISVAGAPSYVESNPRLRDICLEQIVHGSEHSNKFPPEYWVARNIVEYIKELTEKKAVRKQLSTEPGPWKFIILVTKLYKCKKESEDNGVDD